MMLNIFKKLQKNRRILQVIIFIIIIIVFLFNNKYAMAADNPFVNAANWGSGSIGWAVSVVLSIIAYVLTAVIGLLITLMVAILIQVAQYGNIIDVPTVIQGWVIIRDLCNMFFILILLVVAFATILRIESYQWKKILPKLLIMAILINFSKTIFGLLIDFSQVVMLTFVNSFVAGGGWFIKVFQTNMLLSIRTNTATDFSVSAWATSMAIIAGVVAAIITLIVITVMVAILVMRVVMLWIYTIFSPLIFMGFAVPAIQKYTGKIWEDFTKQLVVGPVLAFFIWLALTTAGSSTDSLSNQKLISGAGDQPYVQAEDVCVGAGKFFCQDNFQKFIIVIGLLMGGLMVAQQVGGAVGSIAGKGMAAIQKGGRLLGKGALLPLKGAKNIAGVGLDKLSEVAKIDFNVVRGYKRVVKQMEDNKRKRELSIYQGALEKSDEGGFGRRLAQVSTGDLAWQQISNFYKNSFAPTKRFFKPLKWTQKEVEDREKELGELDDKRKSSYTDKQLEAADHTVEIYEGQLIKIDSDISQAEAKKLKLDPDKDKDKIENLDNQIENWQSKKRNIEKGISIEQNKHNYRISDKDAKDIDDRKKEIVKELEPYKLRDYTVLRNQAQAALESEERKKIDNIDNSQELGQILVGAIKEGNQGLVAAVSKKMSKNGDYNEMLKVLGFGTGRDGMLDYANHLQEEAGFSNQAALGLVGEIGNIVKGIKHFGGFGAVVMENGKWRKTKDRDEYNANIYAEMSKLQLQDFARNTNRLGLGEYIGGNHSIENWRPLEATLKIYEENAPRLAKQYTDTGQPNALLHMAHYEDYMKAAEVGQILIDTIRNSAGGGDVDWERAVREKREALESALNIKIT